MTLISIVVVGVLFSAAIYLILQKNIIPMLYGFSLLTHAANLFILVVSGNPMDKRSPIISEANLAYADPLPQALLLTAIVIGFGVTAYLIVLLYRTCLGHASTDLKEIYTQNDE